MAKLEDLSVSFLSLVKTPATGKGLTLKSAKEGERAQLFALVKTDDEMMRAYGVVYAPDEQDSHGDTADAATIRRAATEFMREGRLGNIDREHSFSPELAFVAESWLVRSGDPLFPDEPAGAWVVGIQIGDPDLWRQLKSGELTGISLAGIARIEADPSPAHQTSYTEKDETPGWFKRLFSKEQNMDKETVEQIVRDTLKSELAPAIKEAMQADEPVSEPKSSTQKQADTETEATTPSSDIDAAVEKAVEKLGSRLEDKITKALAKGVQETGAISETNEGCFL